MKGTKHEIETSSRIFGSDWGGEGSARVQNFQMLSGAHKHEAIRVLDTVVRDSPRSRFSRRAIRIGMP
jgi:hypothetical protein